MKRIPSFTINHKRLQRGVYVSRIDYVGGETVTTYDIRVKTPYKEEPLKGEVSHTIEHIAATWLRNSDIQNDVVYFGPMGCLTGFYLIMKGERKPLELKSLFVSLFKWISEYEGDMPGATEVECGNCRFNDLIGAKQEALSFLNEVVLPLNASNTEYPK